MYFKYAGDKMYDGDGKEYVVLHENDVLAGHVSDDDDGGGRGWMGG